LAWNLAPTQVSWYPNTIIAIRVLSFEGILVTDRGVHLLFTKHSPSKNKKELELFWEYLMGKIQNSMMALNLIGTLMNG